MKQVTILFIFAIIALAGAGCSKPAVNENVPVETNTAAETNFENITDPKAALAEGKRLLDENQTELAIAALKQAIKLDPALAEAHFQLGIAYALYEMQMQLEGTAPQTPSNSNSKEGRSKTNSEKAFERAVEAYDKWIDANPKDDVAYYNLGRAYSKLMKDEEAEKAFKQAVKLKPEDAEYQTELGAILIKLAKYHEAIDALKEAVKLDPENVRAQELLEDAEAGRKRIDYVSPKNANLPNANQRNDSNANMSANSNSNTSVRPSNTNSRPGKDEPKPKPTRTPNKPN
jgi:tetratricopeptide (TPR) repeat protein